MSWFIRSMSIDKFTKTSRQLLIFKFIHMRFKYGFTQNKENKIYSDSNVSNEINDKIVGSSYY